MGVRYKKREQEGIVYNVCVFIGLGWKHLSPVTLTPELSKLLCKHCVISTFSTVHTEHLLPKAAPE